MKRTLAIGDIHGCSKAFETLLKEVKPSSDDVLVTLGDYVDRGPDSKAVLDRLIRLEGETTLVPLLGNHEVLFLDAWKSGTLDSPWMRVGGRETLQSYALGDELSWVYLPEAHHEFLTERCVRYHETDTHFFVHGGAETRLRNRMSRGRRLFAGTVLSGTDCRCERRSRSAWIRGSMVRDG